MKKKKMIFVLLCSMLFFAVSVNGANDWKVLRERTFTGKALYGFMNGGSDLYYEYDFAELKALDVSLDGKKFSVELYKMGSPEDAFGIYSIHAFGFHNRDTILDYCNFSKYQMQAAVGDVYVSIVYETPCEGVNLDAVEIVRKLRVVDGKKPEIPSEILSRADGVTGNVKFMKGKLSIMNGAVEISSYLEGLGNCYVWCCKTADEEKKIAFITSENDENLYNVRERIPKSHLISSETEGTLFYY